MSQVRNEMWMPAMVTKAAFSANFGLSMLCVKMCGVWGGALALSITRSLQLVMLLGKPSHTSKTDKVPLPRRCLSIWSLYISLSSAFMAALQQIKSTQMQATG